MVTQKNHKEVRRQHPLWATAEVPIQSEKLMENLLEGNYVCFGQKPLARRISPKSVTYSSLKLLWQNYLKDASHALAVITAEEESKCLWASFHPHYLNQPSRFVVTSLAQLVKYPYPEHWFETPFLGRVLLNLLVEMPEQHILLLYSGYELDEPVHAVSVAYVNYQERATFYAIL